MSDSDLLTPSLTEAPRTPIFSVNAMIAAAFFGGGFAVPLLAMENSRRLARLRNDLPLLVLGLLVAAAALLITFEAIGAADPSEFRGEFRLISCALGFAFVGAYYFMNRPVYRAMRTVGIEPASLWLGVIAAVLLSLAIGMALRSAALSGLLWELP